MSWIKIIGYKEATGKLKRIYEKIKGPNDVIDNVMTIHSLRPHTLEGHMSLYKSVLHHSSNELPKWYLEVLGVVVSKLNNCNYCAEHHSVGVRKNMGDDQKCEAILRSIDNGNTDKAFDSKFNAGISYAKTITNELAKVEENDIEKLRTAGFSDGEILEVNQVVSYFNYVNRMVVGLGVDLEKSNIGLAPASSDSNDWSHT